MKKTSKTRRELATTRDGIRYDRETGDFAVFAAGQLLGFRATFQEAEDLQRERA
jgi:hypothetical protein